MQNYLTMSSFVTSFIIVGLIIQFNHLHISITGDSDIIGVQKFHKVAVPRIGGVAVYAGFCAPLLFGDFDNKVASQIGISLILSGLFAFLAGLVEDLTKKVGVMTRLLATVASALCAGYWLNTWITHVDLWMFDWILSLSVVSILITCVAISGLANAYNIIDGYNGLAGGVAIMVLLSLCWVANCLGDQPIVSLGLTLLASILGYVLWNYPRGLIFLGDGGAYLIGFLIAELLVLLIKRNPTVSPFFPLMLTLYPITETLFSIYRKKIVRGVSPGKPDGLHLHMLVYKRLVRISSRDIQDYGQIRNALTSPYLWFMALCSIVPAVVYWDYTNKLMLFSLLYISMYVFAYRGIVLFKTPKFLILRRKC
jgi:UDP-N-acetylmuramyl pentapeptide phosphotransferase/UDP-N-acetylglucosamine-1-phosphate transferase